MADREMIKKTVFLIYDADTAAGTNNEGALVFSPFLEDIDHLESGADIFNGQKSVLWVNLRQAFFDEIKSMYKTLRSSGALSYAKVEKMFEGHQGKWPEAIFNEDSWFKYLAPLVEKGNATYLTMLQGSKECQRKWWLYNRFKYLDSKYNAGDSLNDFIELRGYAKGDITVTPYADIYASARYGSYLVQARAKAGEGATLPCPLDSVNDTEIVLYSCSQLKSTGDLSPLKVGRANFSNAKKIQEIKLGDGEPSYSNGNLTELTLGNNTMLRCLDLRNCPNLVAPLDVSHCLNMEELYLDGTAITGLMLPNGGVLKKLHVPTTLANLTVRNQTKITEFSMQDYGGITTLRLENVSQAVPVFDILGQIQDGARVRIIGFHLEFATDAVAAFYDGLDRFRGLDENGGNVDTAQMSGTIHMDTARKDVVAGLKERYPYIDIQLDHYQTSVYYYTYDGSTLLGEEVITDGANGTWANTQDRASTAQYDYTPNGLATAANGASNANALVAVTENRNVYAAYTAVLRKYDVTFVRSAMDGGDVLYTQKAVPYGTKPTYGGPSLSTVLGPTSQYPFLGWEPGIAAVNGSNLVYTATFDSPVNFIDVPDSWEEVVEAIETGTYMPDYQIGNMFTLMYDGTDIRAIIAGINADRDAFGNKVPLTITPRRVIGSSYKQPSTNAATYPRPLYATMPKIDATIRDHIVPVRKRTNVGNNWDSVKTRDTFDKLWLLSVTEVNGLPNVYTSVAFWNETPYANQYKLYKTNAYRIKYTASGAAVNYDVRTLPYVEANHSGGRCNAYVGSDGYYAHNRYRHGDIYVYNAFGFCLGTYYQAHYTGKELSDLQAAVDAGTYKTDFAIGDILKFSIGGEDYGAQVIAFDDADLSDGSGKAAVTLLTYYTKGSGTSATDARGYLAGLHGEITEAERDLIVEVDNQYDVYGGGEGQDVVSTSTNSDRLWLPAVGQTGIQPRRKSAWNAFGKYWLRDRSGDAAMYVQEDGTMAVDTEGTVEAGYVFGFCIGKASE